jgi:ABC-type transporter Mla MlaB component
MQAVIVKTCGGHRVQKDLGMFRISRTDQETAITLTIDGELAKEHVAIAARCCDEILKSGRVVEVVLRDVDAVDESGRNWLAELTCRGVRVVGQNLYLSYIVSELKRPGAQ